MKIMFVNWGLAMGGAEVITASYLSGLKERGQDVSLMELMHRPSYLYQKMVREHIPIHSILHNANNFFFKVLNVLFGSVVLGIRERSIIREVQPDIVHLQMFSEKLFLDGVDTKRVFLTIHSDLYRITDNLSEKGRDMLRKLMMDGMHVIVLSDKARKSVLEFCPSVDVHKIPNGLDLAEIRRKKYDRRQLCGELGVSEDSFILGHVGRFHKVKNHAKLIDIFDSLHKMRPNSMLLLIGDDANEEGPKIHEMVAKRGLADCVRFMGVRSDATALMSCMDAFALTSVSECFSLVSIEAQAFDVRCVLTDAVPEEVVCNKNCFALSINEPSERWAELLLGNTERPSTSYSIEDYDIAKVLDAILRLYRKVLDGQEES